MTVSLCRELFTAFITNTMASWPDLPNQILLFIVLVPFLGLMWWIGVNTFKHFFRDCKETLHPSALFEFVNRQWSTTSVWRRFVVIIFLILCLGTLLGFICDFVLDLPVRIFMTILVGSSFIPPIVTFARVIIGCWMSLITTIRWQISGGPERADRRLNSTALLESCEKSHEQQVESSGGTTNSGPLITVSGISQEQEVKSSGATTGQKPVSQTEKKTRLPIEFLDVSGWSAFMDSQSSIFILIRKHEWSWHFFPAALMICVWIGMIVMDIRRHITFENDSENDKIRNYLFEVANVMCNDFCGMVCNEPGSDCREPCHSNCSRESTYPKSVTNPPEIPLVQQRVFLGVRLFLYLFFFPFAIWANPFSCDFDESETFKLRGIRILGLCFLVFGFIFITIGCALRTLSYPDIPHIPSNITITDSIKSPEAAICHVGPHDWNITQLAGLSLLPEIIRLREFPDSEPVRKELRTVRHILGMSGLWYPNKTYPGYLAPSSFLFAQSQWGKPQQIFIAFPGTRNLNDLAFVIENVMVAWVRQALMVIIPFYRITRKLFFRVHEWDTAETISMAILGPDRLFVHYWVKGKWFMLAQLDLLRKGFWSQKFFAHNTGNSELDVKAVIGHGAYGILAKGFGLEHGWPGIAFDSSQFYNSPVSIYANSISENSPNSSWTADFDSGLSAQIFPEDSTLISESHIMPKNGNFFDTPTVEKTFCMAAAGCVKDNRFDVLCGDLVGSQRQFKAMFESWNRPRTEDDLK
jgi:hypothetical protein